MKHTDFYAQHKQLDSQAREELRVAVKAHGGEYIFIHQEDDEEWNEDEMNDAPIILAATKHMENYEDFYVSRVVVEDGKYLTIYGFPKEGWWGDDMITDIFFGQIECIIDAIPETEEIKDVTIN